MLVWDGAVGFILVEGLFHYFERCEGHLHLWVYFLPSPAPPQKISAEQTGIWLATPA